MDHELPHIFLAAAQTMETNMALSGSPGFMLLLEAMLMSMIHLAPEGQKGLMF